MNRVDRMLVKIAGPVESKALGVDPETGMEYRDYNPNKSNSLREWHDFFKDKKNNFGYAYEDGNNSYLDKADAYDKITSNPEYQKDTEKLLRMKVIGPEGAGVTGLGDLKRILNQKGHINALNAIGTDLRYNYEQPTQKASETELANLLQKRTTVPVEDLLSGIIEKRHPEVQQQPENKGILGGIFGKKK